jgi:hypothetical protein
MRRAGAGARLLEDDAPDHHAAGPAITIPRHRQHLHRPVQGYLAGAIIGLFDLLAIVHNAAPDPEWLGFSTEGYVFAPPFIGCSALACRATAMRMERKLNTGHKR